MRVLVVLFGAVFVLGRGEPLVELPNGWIQGREATTWEGQSYYAFEKIPYATPPVGNLRFKAPLPAQNWAGILNTTYLNVSCHQLTFFPKDMSEDCLYINVYTPALLPRTLMPIMVFIYGGAFSTGSSLENNYPDNFINHGVIFITFNYRVGPLGFLSTQDDVIPGNYGLKDQQLALEWVHENVGLFGGDAGQVTVFGQSAGAASLGYHLLNPKSRGLFQRAIMQSGSSISPWAYQRRARQISFDLAKLIDGEFTGNDSQTLLDFLLKVPPEKFDILGQFYLYTNQINPEVIEITQGCFWGPVLEDANSDDAFISEKMYKLIQNGRVVEMPLILGLTSEESLSFFFLRIELDIFTPLLEKHPDWLPSKDVQVESVEGRAAIGQQIREMYTGGRPWTENFGNSVRYYSDSGWGRPLIRHAHLWAALAPTYFYQFSYDGQLGHFQEPGYNGTGKVAHNEDLAYLFCKNGGCDLSNYPESDRLISKRLVKLWTNFAKFGNPTPEVDELFDNLTWPVVTPNGDFPYLDIDANLTIRHYPKDETYQAWCEIYDNLGHDDFDTF